MLLHYSIMIGVDIQWMLAMSSSAALRLLARKHKNHQWYLVVHLVTIVCVCVYQIKHPGVIKICSVIVSCPICMQSRFDLRTGSLISCYIVYVFHLSVWPILPTIGIQSPQRTPRTPHPSHLQAAVAAAVAVTWLFPTAAWYGIMTSPMSW